MYRRDTIVACATAPGRGAVAILRLSGAASDEILAALFEPTKDKPLRPWMLRHGTLVDRERGAAIDEVLAVRMPGPRTYTGKDMAELHTHGSPVVVRRALALAAEHGARLAEPGEFSRRAVLNGRLDLLQAEAVADLVDATMTGGAALAWRQLQGALSERIGRLRAGAIETLADVETHVDFSDEDLPEESDAARGAALAGLIGEIDAAIASFAVGRRLREGTRVVVVGRPNVGKSSLVNALLGSERMIVSPEAGTTRDAVEESVDVDGSGLVIVDTAGQRTGAGAAETEAVRRSREHEEHADVRLVVIDRSVPLGDVDRELVQRSDASRDVLVLHKADLPTALDTSTVSALRARFSESVATSAVAAPGIEGLVALLGRARDGAAEGEPAAISSVRHRDALARAREGVEAARRALEERVAPELAAVDLRRALRDLSTITDPLGDEEVLDRVFARFCIGK